MTCRVFMLAAGVGLEACGMTAARHDEKSHGVPVCGARLTRF